jgi:hypothetical protein
MTTAPRPMVTFGSTITPGPRNASSSMRTENGLPSWRRAGSVLALKWAMIVARIPIAAFLPMYTRSGFEVSISASVPIQAPLPIVTPRRRWSHGRSDVPPGA